MSKNNKESENMNECKCDYKACCESNKVYKEDQNIYKSISEMYERDDSNNLLTTKGYGILCKLKRIGIIVLGVVALLVLFSVKKTVDNIEARVHNASSVITK
jgi:hypothetical protein